MWYYVASTPLALVNALDVLINVLAVKTLRLSLHEVSLLNAMWILVLLLLSKSAEKYFYHGLSKKSILVANSALTASTLVLYLSILYSQRGLLYVSYAFHAVAFLHYRVGVQIGILENYFSHEWGFINKKVLTTTLLVDGLVLSLLATWRLDVSKPGELTLILLQCLAAGLLAQLVTPQPIVRFTRIVEKLERNAELGLGLTDSLVLLASLGSSSNTTWIKMYLSRRRAVSTLTLLLTSLVVFKISSEYLWTPLPYILINTHGLSADSVLALYGAGKIIASVILHVLPQWISSELAVSLAILLRSTCTLTLLLLTPTSIIVATLLALIYSLGVVVDVAVYSAYLKITLGEKITLFPAISELAGFIGAVSSSSALSTLGLNLYSFIIVLLNFTSLLLVLKALK
ncbi:MAG: hypothetical protein LM557_03390 [Desulfurococcaceae archaeon]|nr:hypothetical protein [Desulfurococcaceae archaeon]